MIPPKFSNSPIPFAPKMLELGGWKEAIALLGLLLVTVPLDKTLERGVIISIGFDNYCMYEAFIDLDELILRCRDKLSRKFIQEAVSCYRAGAFRSCIVATWNAVVFDFLHKLRELELLGDRESAKLLEEFNELISSRSKKFKELWQFESDIPEVAFTKFELLSTVEKSDIERLFEDRSRCAHPSMTSLDEPFEATAELARYHLRSAVTHLLARPPVQGRAAHDRIFQDIKSEYFPVDPELAIQYFKRGPLARARLNLVKDIVIGLTKSLLLDDCLENEKSRQFSALIAVSKMYPQETREILNSKLSEIILNRVGDENWDKTIIYLGSISAWDILSEPCRLKAESYIEKIEIYETHLKFLKRLSENALSILKKASHIGFLKEAVVKKLQIPLKDLLSLKDHCNDEFFKDEIIIPILRDLSSQATLDELLLMKCEPSLRFDEAIMSYIEHKIQDSSLTKLTSIAYRDQDQWLLDLIESNLEIKITTANLQDLLSSKLTYKSINEPKNSLVQKFDDFIAKKVEQEIEDISLQEIVTLIEKYTDDLSFDLVELEIIKKISSASLEELLSSKAIYKLIDKPKPNILESFDNLIVCQVKTASFDELLDQRSHWDEIADQLIEPILRSNVPKIIDRFVNSESYDSAGSNSILLVKVAEYLTSEQWEKILESFFKNSQIRNSGSCYKEFGELFQKSLKLNNNCIQPYWITFRENLDQFIDYDKYRKIQKQLKQLKQLIDSLR